MAGLKKRSKNRKSLIAENRFKNTSKKELGIEIDNNEFDNKFRKIFIENLKNI